jgi:hypothetical protein
MLFGSLGCASNATISGKVTYKGEPLGGGTVLFVAEGKRSMTTVINSDGTYALANFPAGPVTIAVETASVKQTEMPEEAKGMAPPATIPNMPEGATQSIYKPRAATAVRYVEIPPQYADPKTSGLTYTVTGGSQSHDIPLD